MDRPTVVRSGELFPQSPWAFFRLQLAVTPEPHLAILAWRPQARIGEPVQTRIINFFFHENRPIGRRNEIVVERRS